MGDRGNIVIKDTGIYFYTHWSGSDLGEVMLQALLKGSNRWDDCSYLSRIIFQELLGGDTGTTGFGITNSEDDNENPIVEVDVKGQQVSVSGGTALSFAEFVKLTPEAAHEWQHAGAVPD